VVKALCFKPEGLGFNSRWGHWIFSIDLILPAAIGPGVYSASNRNEYQEFSRLKKNRQTGNLVISRVRCQLNYSLNST
jgi:hypothetical protein